MKASIVNLPAESVEIKTLMQELGLNQSTLVLRILKETNYVIDQSTISRILKGESTGVGAGFVLYALQNIKNNSAHPSDIHKDFLGEHYCSTDSDSESFSYFVRADSEAEAINKLASWGFDVHGRRNESDYDCTGLMYASPAHPSSVTKITAMNCYLVTMNWYRDV